MRRWSRRKSRPAPAEHPFRRADDGDPKAFATFEQLLRDRIVLVAGMIDDRSATLVIAQLLYTGRDLETLVAAGPLDANEAIAQGIVDRIVPSRPTKG